MLDLNVGQVYNKGYVAGTPTADDIFEGYVSTILKRLSDMEETFGVIDYDKAKFG